MKGGTGSRQILTQKVESGERRVGGEGVQGRPTPRWWGGGALLAANCKDRRLLELGINQTSSATPAKQVSSSEIPTKNEINFQNDIRSTSLVVQWLRLCF